MDDNGSPATLSSALEFVGRGRVALSSPARMAPANRPVNLFPCAFIENRAFRFKSETTPSILSAYGIASLIFGVEHESRAAGPLVFRRAHH